jgi:uncharacterized alkaline shock family protein YloU
MIEIARTPLGTISLEPKAPRGAVLPELGKHVQARISEALVETLDVPPSRVDVTVEGIRAEVEG